MLPGLQAPLLPVPSPAAARRGCAPASVPQDRGHGEARRAEGERQGQEPPAPEKVQRHGYEAPAVRLLLQQAALCHARRRPRQEDALLRQHPAGGHLRRPTMRHRGGRSEGWGGAREGVQGAGHLRGLVLRPQRVRSRRQDDGVRGSDRTARFPAEVAESWHESLHNLFREADYLEKTRKNVVCSVI